MEIFLPVIDNGLGLSRTSWGVSLAATCAEVFRDDDLLFRHVSYPYPDGALNIVANEFLESGADEMFVIDTDLVFDPRHIRYMREHDEPLVFGLYPKKEVGLTFPAEPLESGQSVWHADPHDSAVNPLVEVKRVARGLMRAKRAVFERLSPLVPEYKCDQSGKMRREFFRCLPGCHSEDFAFCDLWRSAGGRVLVDQRASVRHEGSAVYPIRGTF